MFFSFLKNKLKKSYSVINKDFSSKVFPYGEAEYVYVGTILHTLFKNQDIFKLIQIYASVYMYYKLEFGNIAKTYIYTKAKSAGILTDGECKTLIGLVMLNTTSNYSAFPNPLAMVDHYKGYVISYLETVEGIKKNYFRFKTKAISAGTVGSPILVAGTRGVHQYIDNLKIPGVDKVTFSRTSALHLTDNICNVSYAIDEYTLTDAASGTEIASLWFNIYGTENTTVQPMCFSDKIPFSAAKIAPELFAAGTAELKSVEGICKNAHIPYDYKKLVISTFAYFFVVWNFGFKSIRMGQAFELEEMYIEEFVKSSKVLFEGCTDTQSQDNKKELENMLKRVDGRVRNSYQANNNTLVDDGLSSEYIAEFVSNIELTTEIKTQIADKIMNDWQNLGKKADETYLT